MNSIKTLKNNNAVGMTHIVTTGVSPWAYTNPSRLYEG